MLVRLLTALAVLSGKSKDMPRAEAFQIARACGYGRGRSSGKVRRALNLKGRPAYNEHRPPRKLSDNSPYDQDWEDFLDEWRQNRNAAKARRRSIRAAGGVE